MQVDVELGPDDECRVYFGCGDDTVDIYIEPEEQAILRAWLLDHGYGLDVRKSHTNVCEKDTSDG